MQIINTSTIITIIHRINAKLLQRDRKTEIAAVKKAMLSCARITC